jgi:hypothetical protein
MERSSRGALDRDRETIMRLHDEIDAGKLGFSSAIAFDRS